MRLSEVGVGTQEALNTTLCIAFHTFHIRLKMVNLDANFGWLSMLCASVHSVWWNATKIFVNHIKFFHLLTMWVKNNILILVAFHPPACSSCNIFSYSLTLKVLILELILQVNQIYWVSTDVFGFYIRESCWWSSQALISHETRRKHLQLMSQGLVNSASNNSSKIWFIL